MSVDDAKTKVSKQREADMGGKDVTPPSPAQEAINQLQPRTVTVPAMFPIAIDYEGVKFALHGDGTVTGDPVALENAMQNAQRTGDGLAGISMWLILHVMKGQTK